MLTKILIICLLLLQIPTATFAIEMKDALIQAVDNLFRDEKFLSSDYSVFVRVADKHSGKQNHVTKDVEAGLFLALLSNYPGRNFMLVSKEESDISIEGISQKKGDVVQLQLNVSRNAMNGDKFSNTSVVFVYRQKKETSNVIVLNIESDFISPSNQQRYSQAFRTAVKRQNNFTVFSSPDLSLFSQEEALKKNDCQGETCAVIIGKQFDVDLVLVTHVTKTSSSLFHIFCRLINVNDGNLHLATRIKHLGSLAYLPFTLEKVATQLADKQKWVSLVKELEDLKFSEVIIKSKPDKANIFLDGKPLWKRTNTTLKKIQPGQHTFRVVYNNSSAQKMVFLSPGESTELEFIITPFKVQSATPSQTDRYISLDSEFMIRFNTDIDPSTVTLKTFSLERKGKQIPGTIEKSKREIRFKPSVALKLQQRYLLKASNYIKDKAGNYLTEDFYHMYRTQPYPNQKDEEILIFSNSHADETYTLRKKGKLQIGITTFTPIKHIDVNGIKLKTIGETLFVYEIPYQLNQKNKRKDYVISVLTKQGMAQKQFTLHFGRKPKPKAPAFSTVGILKYTTLDNVNSSASGTKKESASKYTLTIVPQYRFDLSSSESITTKGILLRDQFTDDAYQDSEVSYTQVALEWKNTKTAMGETKLGLGYNDIKLNNQESPNGSKALTTEQFVNLGFMKKVDKTFSFGFSLEYKQQDSKLEITDDGDNADATVITLQHDMKAKFLGATNAIRFKYGTVDAVGKYKDTTNIYGSFKQSFKFGNIKPSWSYIYKQTDYTTKDDRLSTVDGSNLYKNIATTSVKLGYQLVKTITLALEYKNKKQESNVQSYNYENNSQIISFTQMF
jgi:hypothetical protein